MRIWIKLPGLKGRESGSAMVETHLRGHGFAVCRRSKYLGKIGPKVVVCWGSPYDGPLPALNKHVNQYNKMTALEMFRRAGIDAPYPHHKDNGVAVLDDKAVYLARNIQHHEGRDIIVCKTLDELRAAMHQRDFFVKWIPTAAEYRAWVYQDKLLAVYEKQFKGEGKFDGYSRNNRFGFEFVARKAEGVKDVQRLQEASIGAVKALNLDWGAVDVIRGKDGKYYVLEVNTAPAINGLDRKSGIELAKQVAGWATHV